MDMNLSKLWETGDTGAWWAAVHGVTKRRTWLSDWKTTKNSLHSFFSDIFQWYFSNIVFFAESLKICFQGNMYKTWCSNTMATWFEQLTHWKIPWCLERSRAGGGRGAIKGGDRGWDGWMASPTQWTWVGINSGTKWSARKPGMLQSMGSQRTGHNLVTNQQNANPEIDSQRVNKLVVTKGEWGRGEDN